MNTATKKSENPDIVETKTKISAELKKEKAQENTGIFKSSAKDSILVSLAIVNLIAIAATAVYFEALSWPVLTALAFYFVFMVCTNYQCISHNHLHNPFFKSEFLNSLFSMMNSIVLGMSQTLYRIHHLNHHVFNNDFQNPETGKTGDWSSFYRWSKQPNKPESIWTYSLLGPLRVEYLGLWKNAAKKNMGLQVWLDNIAMVLFYGAIAFINWKFVVFYFLPVFYIGQAGALAENFLEHYGADPSSRKKNSVSCYSKFYNWIWFNNGYHQEHHYRPQVHWTKIHEVKDLLPPESERRVVKGSHIGNLFAPKPLDH